MKGENKYVSQMLQRTALYFSEDEIEKVRQSVFAIAGLGGVGAITAELIARWGVKRFRLLDMDRYDPSNLNRQLFATSKTLGRPKVEVTAERIREINPHAEIEKTVMARVDNENVDGFIRGADIVIQNADYPSCKLFYHTAQQQQVPLVNGYASLSGGRVQTFNYRDSACSSRLDRLWARFKFGNDKPLNEMSPDEVAAFDNTHVHPTAPSLNFVTNMVGCLIVAEAIKLLTGQGELANYPKYLEFDVFRYKMRIRNAASPFNTYNLKRIFSVARQKLIPAKRTDV